MALKRLCSYGVLLFPLLLLLTVAVVTVRDLYVLRAVDLQIVRKALKAHLAGKKPVSFRMPDEIWGLNAAKTNEFIFGESSLVLSDGGRFPDYLNADHEDLRVVNFRVSGIDSVSVRQRVREAR